MFGFPLAIAVQFLRSLFSLRRTERDGGALHLKKGIPTVPGDPSDDRIVGYGCFFKLRVLFVGALTIRVLLLGVYVRAPDL